MSVTRRGFLGAVPAVGAAMVLGPLNPRGPQSPGGWEGASAAAATGATPDAAVASATPVVSFHLDQPYLDLTGLAKPYIPPAGMRSGASLAALSEEEVLSRFYGFI